MDLDRLVLLHLLIRAGEVLLLVALRPSHGFTYTQELILGSLQFCLCGEIIRDDVAEVVHSRSTHGEERLVLLVQRLDVALQPVREALIGQLCQDALEVGA